ncbi:MAG: sulfatase [Planctomycetes bacterium]|nr:sulfatase [Planctomycetota bacterium]
MLLLLPAGGCAPPETPRPNFVLILADDLGYADVGCYLDAGAAGAPAPIRTPNLDRLADQGIRFTSFYSAAPLCTAARAALLTGCYPVRVGMSLPDPRGRPVLYTDSNAGLALKEVTLAEVLRDHGYATALIGKWHLGCPPFSPENQGFDEYFGPAGRAEVVDHDEDERTPGATAFLAREELTERYTAEAIRFIDKNRDRPFFLFLAHSAPHVPLAVSPAFAGKSARGLYGDVVECLDWSTGEILGALERLGLAERTLVTFTSDNGPALEHGADGGSAFPLRSGKATTGEGGMRVPCALCWPGIIPAGRTCSEVVTALDLLPTFAALAGASLPPGRAIDGEDLEPLLKGEPGARGRRAPFFYYNRNGLEAARSGRWKLTFGSIPHSSTRGQPLALYDLETDAGEWRNVIAANPAVATELADLAQAMREELGDDLLGMRGQKRRPPGRIRVPPGRR